MQLKLQLQTTKKGDLSVDEYIMKMRGFADLLAAAGKTISDDDLALQILAGFGTEYVAYNRSGTDGGYGNRGGFGYGFRGGRGGRFNNKDTRPICQLCGKPGHVALKCYKRFDVHFTGISSSSPQAYFTDFSNNDYPQEGYGYYNENDAGYGYHNENDARWVVDSGATNHITHDLANLQVSTPYTGIEK